MATAPFLRKLEFDAVRAKRAERDRPAGRGGLRLVAEAPRVQVAPPAARPALDGIALDDQGRFSASRLLTTLGWTPDTAVEAHLDVSAGVLWLRRQEPPARPADADDACACGCTGTCRQQPAARAALPGAPTAALEAAAIDAKRQVVLPAGLRHALGLRCPGSAVAVAVRPLDAVAVAPLRTVLEGGLKELVLLPTQPIPTEPGA